MTRLHVRRGNRDMGLLRLVGSLKLNISLAEYRLFCRSLLQTIVSFTGLFCIRDVFFRELTNRSHPIKVTRMRDIKLLRVTHR